MKLFPPQPDFKLYKTGFGTDDLLDRKTVGEDLSKLLERIEDPLVVALDGPWGSGKSYFLKRWVGAHTQENGGKATTIYFDAFANDFLDEPLIALTGEIADKLGSGNKKKIWDKAKQAAVTLARPAFRAGLAMATAGISEVAGSVVGAGAEAAGKSIEEAAEEFWKREDGRKAAMMQFKGALSKITKPSTAAPEGKPLIIVIDELDRCRPDYALSFLEVIKHFFSEDRVHFVLGVNLEALEHIVRARYGSSVNASEYLKRFISLTVRLPDFVMSAPERMASIEYFNYRAKHMGFDEGFIEKMGGQISLILKDRSISLRDIEKILMRSALIPFGNDFSKLSFGRQIICLSLALFQVFDPVLFEKARQDSVEITDINKFYGIKEIYTKKGGDNYIHTAYILRGLWRFIIEGNSSGDEDARSFASSFDSYHTIDHKKMVKSSIKRWFNNFSISQ